MFYIVAAATFVLVNLFCFSRHLFLYAMAPSAGGLTLFVNTMLVRE